jgi:hemolysin III
MALHFVVRLYGLDGLVRHSPILAACRIPRIALDHIWRLAYTSGIAFYLAKRLPYSHLIWHLFVSAGTACHFCAVLWYAG